MKHSPVFVRCGTLVAFALTLAGCVGAPEKCRDCFAALLDGGGVVPDLAPGTGGDATGSGGGIVLTGGTTGSGGEGTGGAASGGTTGSGGRGTGGVATGGMGTGGVATGGMATGGAASGGMGTGGRGTGGANTGGANTGGAAVDPTLVLWYKFDETSGMTAMDSSGNTRTGTLTNVGSGTAAFSSMDKVPPGSCSLTSSSNTAGGYVSVPASLNAMGAGTAVTIAMWVLVRTDREWARVFDFGNSTTAGYFFLTTHAPGASLRATLTLTTNGSAEQSIDRMPSAAFPTGGWHHIAVTLGTGTTYTGTLYYDKAVVGTNAAMTIRPSALGNTTRNYIGRSQWDDPLFDGYIDDFRVYSRALTTAEIAALP